MPERLDHADRARAGHQAATTGHACHGHSLPPSRRAGQHGRRAGIISNGRLELGIGAGWNEEESGTYGIELGTLKERFARFEEACGVLTSLLGAETTDLTYWLRVVPASGATQRRSPCPPTFLDADRNYGQVVEDATGLAAEGLDLGIVYIPTPHDPAVLEPLAEAIRDSGLQDS